MVVKFLQYKFSGNCLLWQRYFQTTLITIEHYTALHVYLIHVKTSYQVNKMCFVRGLMECFEQTNERIVTLSKHIDLDG